MHRQLKNPRFYIMIFADVCLLMMAHIAAYVLRFEFSLGRFEFSQMLKTFLWFLPMKIGIFFGFGLYRGMWRYVSIRDFWRLAQASLMSTLLGMAVILYLYRFQGYSRAVFMLDGLLTFLLTGGLRIIIRSYYAAIPILKFGFARQPNRKDLKGVLIIGAGDAGEKILREIFDNDRLLYEVVGFIDDDPEKQGRSIHGIPVLGPVKRLPDILSQVKVDEVLIAVPSATGSEMRHIVDMCKGCNIVYKTLPGMGEIIDGRVSLKILRDVSYEDLLGRPPVYLDTANINNYIYDRTILITGCGGSIGSELCRHISRFNPRTIILLDASEANLFQIQMELHHEKQYHNYQPILGRVQEESLVKEVFRKYRPQVVFHAAAYKHVPMLEKNPWEAVFNNILGSLVTMKAAIDYQTERFVLVSTDKAVMPTNVMGASKRISELLLQSLQGNETKLMAVRFGNVVGSSGSVVPLFRWQIEKGGPITVTHPDVTRYFMTIPEAAQLIIQAGSMGEGGEIFILEMGTPVRIADMARDLIKLSGKEPDKDIQIIYTGLREGEKLYEELITAGENVIRTVHEKILMLRPSTPYNGFAGHDEFRAWLDRELAELYAAAMKHDATTIKKKMKDIVPEYSPQETTHVF